MGVRSKDNLLADGLAADRPWRGRACRDPRAPWGGHLLQRNLLPQPLVALVLVAVRSRLPSRCRSGQNLLRPPLRLLVIGALLEGPRGCRQPARHPLRASCRPLVPPG